MLLFKAQTSISDYAGGNCRKLVEMQADWWNEKCASYSVNIHYLVRALKQGWEGEISSLSEKDACRIHGRLPRAMRLLAPQMCFLTHNRLRLDLIGHISLPLWTSLHLLCRVIIFTHT